MEILNNESSPFTHIQVYTLGNNLKIRDQDNGWWSRRQAYLGRLEHTQKHVSFRFSLEKWGLLYFSCESDDEYRP